MNIKEMAVEEREKEALRLQPWKLRWLGLLGCAVWLCLDL